MAGVPAVIVGKRYITGPIDHIEEADYTIEDGGSSGRGNGSGRSGRSNTAQAPNVARFKLSWIKWVILATVLAAVVTGLLISITLPWVNGSEADGGQVIEAEANPTSQDVPRVVYQVQTTPEEIILSVTARENNPGVVEVPDGWRWDLMDLSIVDYTTDAVRDSRGYRLQSFYPAKGKKEIVLPIKLTKCTAGIECAW